MAKILFLGYDRTQTSLIKFIENEGHCVTCISRSLKSLDGYDLVVSFGYRHFLKEDVIETSNSTPINLHISYLPFNKGAHPNFWSWVEGTPSGITIHEIAPGLDTGKIIIQEEIENANENQTFSETYTNLISQLENLFMKNFDHILHHDYEGKPQLHRGTYHHSKQLPDWVESWDMKIADGIKKYRSQL